MAPLVLIFLYISSFGETYCQFCAVKFYRCNGIFECGSVVQHMFNPGITEGCMDGDVRMESFGRVEVCSNGEWGAICLDSATSPWSEKNAQVVCKQLMFSGALNSVLPNMYVFFKYSNSVQCFNKILFDCSELAPAGTPYHLGSVQCYGNETSLDQCISTSVTQCTSKSVAAVACRPSKSDSCLVTSGGLSSAVPHQPLVITLCT